MPSPCLLTVPPCAAADAAPEEDAAEVPAGPVAPPKMGKSRITGLSGPKLKKAEMVPRMAGEPDKPKPEDQDDGEAGGLKQPLLPSMEC